MRGRRTRVAAIGATGLSPACLRRRGPTAPIASARAPAARPEPAQSQHPRRRLRRRDGGGRGVPASLLPRDEAGDAVLAGAHAALRERCARRLMLVEARGQPRPAAAGDAGPHGIGPPCGDRGSARTWRANSRRSSRRRPGSRRSRPRAPCGSSRNRDPLVRRGPGVRDASRGDRRDSSRRRRYRPPRPRARRGRPSTSPLPQVLARQRARRRRRARGASATAATTATPRCRCNEGAARAQHVAVRAAPAVHRRTATRTTCSTMSTSATATDTR